MDEQKKTDLHADDVYHSEDQGFPGHGDLECRPYGASARAGRSGTGLHYPQPGMNNAAAGGPPMRGAYRGGDGDYDEYTPRSGLPPPPRSDPRILRCGELDDHIRPGGQTNAGERPRGAERSRYADSEASRQAERGTRAGGDEGGGVPKHAWFPETEVYEAEKTRRK